MAYSDKLKYVILLIITFATLAIPIQAQQPKIGDVNDGSRSKPIHLLDLLDADSSLIRPDDSHIMPFSTKQTCIHCHDYDKISAGWHFNTANRNIAPGRPGHPWILVDQLTATQIPLSHRQWQGTFKPGEVGLTPWWFIQQFGRQMPGGGVGENDSSDVEELFMRWLISGKLEINCLSCHDAESLHDQAEYARQTRNQNYRWAAAATSGFATVRGSAKNMPDNYDIYLGVAPDDPRSIPPSIEYNMSRFNPQGKVLFDVTRNIPNDRCYFCHSSKFINNSNSVRWQTDEDVHLVAGLKCVNCHRNGLDHAMVRGYEEEAEDRGNPSVASLTCEGCHIGNKKSHVPQTGRLGAPRPKHTGLPTIHFEKLSCTACHSGSLPSKKANLVKTSQAHGLGTHTILHSDDRMPYIIAPVFVKEKNGKIAPHKMMWPSFWGFVNGDSLKPIAPKSVQPIALAIIAKDTLTDSTNYSLINSGKWPDLTADKLAAILDSLSTLYPDRGKPAYTSAGKLFYLSGSKQLLHKEHQSGQPYSWPLAHDVRPARQSLGSKGCGDCHSITAHFSFGKVKVPSPLSFEQTTVKSMIAFQGNRAVYPRIFALTFFGRPILKFLLLISWVILAAVLILYIFKGLDAILKAQVDER